MGKSSQRWQAALSTLCCSWSALAMTSLPMAFGADSAPAGATSEAAAGHVVAGGTQVVDAATLGSLGSLSVLKGATAIIDFSSKGKVTLSGDLTNSGTIYAISSANKTAHFNASNIFNQTGALFTTVLPSGGLVGFTDLVSGLNLNLTALKNIVNNGTISSAGNLTLGAGGAIVNHAALSAAQNINLASSSGNLVNSGTIIAALGNINIASQLSQSVLAYVSQTLNISNTGGLLQALNGAINIRDVLFLGDGDTTLSGGNWLSRELNIHAGSGDVVAQFDDVSGDVNTFGNYARIGASTDNLVLGTTKIDGDPVYYNAAGDITVNGDVIVSEALAILASGNIITTAAVTEITAESAAGGHSIHLVAGANLTPGCGTCATTVPGTQATVAVTVDGASSTGGNIDFTASPNITISSRGSLDTNGGDVIMVAFADNVDGTNGGRILLPGATPNNSGSEIRINGGAKSGADGNVTFIAGADSGVAITTGKILATGGGSGTGGNITMTTAQPTSSSVDPITFATNGTISSGNMFVPKTLQSGGAQIHISNDLTATGIVELNAQNGINAVEYVAATIPVGINPGGVAVSADGAFAYVANYDGESISVIDTATNSIINTIAASGGPKGVAISPNGKLLYIANFDSDLVSVVKSKNGQLIRTIPVADGPTEITLNTSGSLAFVSSVSGDTVSIIDTKKGTVASAFGLTGTPLPLSFNHSNSLLYVGIIDANTITIIDPRTNSSTDVPLSFSPLAFGTCPCGTKLFIADGVAGVHAFSTETNSVVASIALPPGSVPSAMGINPTGSLAYSVNSGNGTVSTINTLTNVVSSTTTVGGSPLAVGGSFGTFVGNNAGAYVPNSSTNSVSLISTPTVSASNYEFRSVTGAINLSIAGGVVKADNPGGSVIITSANSIVSSGGSGVAFQLATPNNLTVNAPINAGLIDLHAINGSFTNNSTIHSDDLLFFVASPTIFNNGTLSIEHDSGPSFLSFQAPSGDLFVTLAPNSQISSLAPNHVSTIVLNPAGGTSIFLRSSTGSSISADNIEMGGDRGNYFIDARMHQISGSIIIDKSPTYAFLQSAQGSMMFGNLDLSQTSGGGTNFSAKVLSGDLVVDSINADYSGPDQNKTKLKLISSGNIVLNDSVSAQAVGGRGGTLSLEAKGGSISMPGTATEAINTSGQIGGKIQLKANSFQIDGLNNDGSSIKSEGSAGKGGTIDVTSKGPFPLSIGSSGGANYIAGTLVADGFPDGKIKVHSAVSDINLLGSDEEAVIDTGDDVLE